ncbi:MULTISPECIES: porin [Cupriavidus]|uniref:Porin n=1 Tax=Cupriavidus pauculus TaxID=82633 RepID=A0A3G8GZ51_9BURK|nr:MULTISPECIES: porin [Cupriavidus]AZG13230.1 porin [Cupriavidus pauculus]MDT6964307.1 porin [Cupriavidus sp. SZY C1]
MKMKLFAAAVAALAAGGAYAQSSVTLYGVVDAGVEYANHQPGVAGSHDVVRLTSGNMSGSRWGLRGVEDLGGGLKGIFVLESGFNVDTGTQGQGNRLFGRQAFVGVQSQFGTLSLGRHQTPLYDFGLAFDPMAISTNYSITTQDGGFASRADNSIKYTGTFGGLTGSLLYSTGSNTGATAGNAYQGNAGEVPGNYKLGREYAASLIYNGGPFSIGAVYDEVNPGIALADDAKIRRASVAGTYAFGPAKVFAGYRWAKASDGARLAGGTLADGTVASSRSNLYWLGMGYQLTPALSLTGAAYYQDFNNTGADPWSFVVSTDYAFSKRTDAYLNVSYAKNKDGSTLGVSSGGPGAIAGSGFGTTQGSANQFGAVVGVRHKF